MADAWGLSKAEQRTAGAPQDGAAPRKRKLPPKVAKAAHSGIVWLHLSAIVVWLLVGAVLGVVAATGRDVPMVAVVAGLGAAAGHGLFLAVHLVLASAAQKRVMTPQSQS
ncbi:MAG TPA: hypothetical protein VHS99_09780 [Chloroflexota bacterium]|jgi:hypothetical protein|nr:hypothetical protein [Chloroflexota bacterium]